MATYNISTPIIPQTQQAHKNQIKNDASGFSFPVGKWERLNRFLIIGSEKGTFYVSEQKLVKENMDNTIECIKEDGLRVVKLATDISDKGKAVKNEPAILVLAQCLVHGNQATKNQAKSAVTTICRTGTAIHHLASYLNSLGGWNRVKRTAISNWYNQSVKNVAFQAVKYQQRDGWGHRDSLRLAHVKPQNLAQNALFNWIVKGVYNPEYPELEIVGAFEASKVADKKTTIQLINQHGLTREMIKTEFLKDVDVQAALFDKMPMTALIRNLGNLSASGLFGKSEFVQKAVKRITDPDTLKKARIHPISLLIALKQYSSGSGFRGSNTWNANSDIIDALNDAFYLAFDNVTATNKRLLVAVDCSGSMSSANCVGIENMTPAEAAGAMALVIKSTEPQSAIVKFDTETYPTTISKRQRLDDVLKQFKDGGGTNCDSPIRYAITNNIIVDAFIILTDSQTWQGKTHPFYELEQYRRKINRNTALITLGCSDNGFTIGSPEDAKSFDICGFSGDVPNLINGFLSDL